MRITIVPTPQFFMAGEVMVRAWQGTDALGSPVIALVVAVAGPNGAPEAFDGLVEVPPPDAAAAVEWARKLLDGKDGA